MELGRWSARRNGVELGACLAWGVAAWIALEGIAVGQHATEFPVMTASSGLLRITAGPDGNLWFTENEVNRIGRITPAGVVTEFPLPNADSNPNGITAGPDGALWFAESSIPSRIGRITPAGAITEFLTTSADALPAGMCSGPDGNLWFTEPGTNSIGKITTAGTVTEYPITTLSNTVPVSIAAGSDGALWFTEQHTNRIGRITTAGAVTDFPIPTNDSMPLDIAAGPDSNLWFTENGSIQIGRITTAGVITEFVTPSLSGVAFIAAGPDGNMWFTEPGPTGHVGRSTTGGTITQYPTASAGAQPAGIRAGPDGALWFTEPGVNKIGRITTGPAAAKFFTLTPCRVADTRNPNGPYGGPALSAGANRSFVLTSQCGIPPGAIAVSFNFTVTEPTGAGDIRVFPAGAGLPLVSTLNWRAGQTRANNDVGALGPSGDITVHVDQVGGGTVQFIIDVNGYFQ